jgi:hypothetical protein
MIAVGKLRRRKWERYVTAKEDEKVDLKNMKGGLSRRPNFKLEDNIQMNIKEIQRADLGCIITFSDMVP